MEHSIYDYVKNFPGMKKLIDTKTAGDSSSYQAQCKSFNPDKLNASDANGEQFDNSCSKIYKYFTDVVTVSNPPKAALCKYINYWLYGALNEKGKPNYSTLLGELYQKITKLGACGTYKIEITPEIYKDLNLLYELYDDFNKFKDESLVSTKETCEHGKTCIQKYKDNAKNCHYNYKNGLCMNLINFKYEYDEHIAKMTGCKKDIENLETIKTDLEAIILLPFVTMTLISFILIFLYKFTSFGSWIRPKLGMKNKTNKLEKKMQELQNISEIEGRRYKLPYHTSYS
ncbi:PIR protein [Plasmodium vivax]|uniref:VIR protein n=1 Tax=Plasmodium vivax TaxID=5855 RepID=A0A565A656_PLAVI|nr:PIR protein [Plasmodium vivax]